MATNQKIRGRAKSIPEGLAVGWIAELVIAGLFCAGIAALILVGKMRQENIGYGTIATLLASSYAGATISYRTIKRKKLFVCLLSGALFLATLFGITALFFDGLYQAMGATFLLVFGGSAAAALTNTSRETEQGRGKKRKL